MNHKRTVIPLLSPLSSKINFFFIDLTHIPSVSIVLNNCKKEEKKEGEGREKEEEKGDEEREEYLHSGRQPVENQKGPKRP